ncbi:DUF1127 domain-containing protein [Inquilinus sp.]|jgi:uncharacterized protein YjiS (DUF1127 family)|uniref:DUF1127 domain-containing protein n=1 Tax=Inquilinus sp. TaxID=1932117 RepID=UPI0037833D9F
MTMIVADRTPRTHSTERHAGGLGRVLSTLALWSFRDRTRRRLQALDSHLLNDIGLSRDDVRAEGEKPFWRA